MGKNIHKLDLINIPKFFFIYNGHYSNIKLNSKIKKIQIELNRGGFCPAVGHKTSYLIKKKVEIKYIEISAYYFVKVSNYLTAMVLINFCLLRGAYCIRYLIRF